MPGSGLYEVGSGKTYATIQAALNQLFTDQGTANFSSTQIISVYNGTYSGNSIIEPTLHPTASYNLIIENASGNTPLISGYLWIESLSYVTIRGFDFVYSSTSGKNITGASANYINIYNNIFHIANSGSSIDLPGLRNSNIYNNYFYSDGVNPGAAVFLTGDTRECSVYNNLIKNCSTGILMYTEGENNGTKNYIYSNTIYKSLYRGIFYKDASNNANSILYCKNNIIQTGVGDLDNNSYCIQYQRNNGTGIGAEIFNNNCYYVSGAYTATASSTTAPTYAMAVYNNLSDWQTYTSQDSNSIQSDPVFNSSSPSSVADFKIKSNSPCLNTGYTLGSPYNIDYYGTSRPQLSSYDMGFYEKTIINTVATSNGKAVLSNDSKFIIYKTL